MATLRLFLTQVKPVVYSSINAKGASTSQEYPNVTEFTPWESFNLVNLNVAWGLTLNQPTPLLLLNQTAPPSIVVSSNKHLNLLFAWNSNMMRCTLGHTMPQNRQMQGITLHHQVSTPDNSTRAKVPNWPGKLLVNHVISLTTSPERTLVVGLAIPSSKFSGERLLTQIPDIQSGLVWPLRQLANICDKAGTTYGYIQTEQELTVCSFNRSATDGTLAVQIKPIPWSIYGVENLTADLALWWLSMIAVSSL
jgi:hypothetical protein